MPETNSAFSNYCIALQPICNAQWQHVGDELLYRHDPQSTQALIECGLTATVRACNAALFEIGLENLVGQRTLFFNAPRDWLLSPELLPPSSEQLVIEVLESVTVDQQLIQRLHQLRELGYRLALDDFVLTEATRPLLELADIIKVDMLEPLDEASIELYQRHDLQLLAEKVETLDTFNQCKALGFSLFQGHFYARAEVHAQSRRHRESNHAAQLQLLELLYSTTPDFHRLEYLLVQDPELCVALLKQANSAANRRLKAISSIHQALTVLGLQRLRQLVIMLMLARNGPASLLMLPQLLTRAAMCEALTRQFSRHAPDEAFTVGVFSLIHVLLGESRQHLLDSVPLSDNIKQAISHGQGEAGRILRLVLAHEQGKLAGVSEELINRVNLAYLQSCSWTTAQLKVL